MNGRGLRKADNSSSDPYVVVKVKGKDMFETKSISTNINPNWDCKKEFQISYDKSVYIYKYTKYHRKRQHQKYYLKC